MKETLNKLTFLSDELSIVKEKVRHHSARSKFADMIQNELNNLFYEYHQFEDSCKQKLYEINAKSEEIGSSIQKLY